MKCGDFQGLSMVTTHPDSGDQAMLGMEVESSARSHDWLLKHLPALPVFPYVMAQMCETLRQVLAYVRLDFHVTVYEQSGMVFREGGCSF